MTYYVHTDDLSRPRHLPKSWRNVSGLHLLSDSELADLGWYPWENTPQPEHDEIHDYLAGSVEIQNGKAVQVWTPTRREAIPSVDQITSDAANAIKQAAGDTITSAYPIYKQINMTARAAQLLGIRNERPLTEDEIAEQHFLEAVLAWVTMQRSESNRLEAVIEAIRLDDALDNDIKRLNIRAITFTAVA